MQYLPFILTSAQSKSGLADANSATSLYSSCKSPNGYAVSNFTNVNLVFFITFSNVSESTGKLPRTSKDIVNSIRLNRNNIFSTISLLIYCFELTFMIMEHL